MSNYLPDGRVPRTKTIVLDNAEYEIIRCEAGGNSLCYFVTNETGTHYVVKEFYPGHCAYREESTGKICSIPGYEPVYDELKKRFRNENEYVNKASAETYQVGSYFEQFYDQEGYALMRRHSKDLHSLSALIQEFCDNKLGSMDRLNAAIEIMISLLSALEKLHDTIHIIHFDLSLSNVLYSQSNGQYHASLMDFGSARVCDEDGKVSIDGKLDIPGSTQEFGAPELAFSKHLTTAADIYSAGIIFYHLITSGIGCYSGKTIPPAEVLSRGGNLEMQYGIESLDILPGVKSTLLDILCCSTWADPSVRFKCSEMIKELKTLREIVANKGIHREGLLRSSLEKYRAVEAAGFGHYIPALFPEMDMNIPSHMLITGDGGSGKSTFFKRLWKQYADNMLRDSSNPIPLYIELQRFTGANKEDFILQSILSTYAPYYADVENPIQRLKNLFAEGPYLLLLDGMNESTNPQGLMFEIGALTQNPNLIICIATREKPQWDPFEEFREIEIPHLSEDVIQDQLHQAGYAPAEGRLLQTLHRPMMLALYLGLGAQKQVQTPGEILLAHHDRLITNFKKVRHEQKFTDLREFVLDKVFPLFAERMVSLHFDYDTAKNCLLECSDAAADRSKVLGDRVWEKWQIADRKKGLIFNIGAILEVLQQAGLLRAADTGYAYSHQMYQEFYSALAIKQQMDDKNQDPLTTQLGHIPIQQPILSMLGDLWREYNFATKKDLVSEPSKIEDWLQRNMRGKTGPAAQMVVRNLVECMKYSRNNCITAKYDGLDLSLVRFYGCSLPKSSFKNAKVSEFTFVSDGHKKNVTSMAFAPEKGLLFTCEGANLFCWNAKTGVLQYRCVVKEKCFIGTLDVSPDEKLLLVTFDDGICFTVLNIDDGSFVSSFEHPGICGDSPPEYPELLDVLSYTATLCLTSFLADSEKILLASSDGVLWHVSAKTGKQISPHVTLELSQMQNLWDMCMEYTWYSNAFKLSNNRETLAVCHRDGAIEVYNAENLCKNKQASAKLENVTGTDIAFSLDDQYLIVLTSTKKLVTYSFLYDKIFAPTLNCQCLRSGFTTDITGTLKAAIIRTMNLGQTSTFLWHFETNTEEAIFNVPQAVTLFSYTYMGHNFLFYADDSLSVTFLDAETLYERGCIDIGYTKRMPGSHIVSYCGTIGKKIWRLTWAGQFQMISPDNHEMHVCSMLNNEIHLLGSNDSCVYWQDGENLNVYFTDTENNIVHRCITVIGKVLYISPEKDQIVTYYNQTIKTIELKDQQKEIAIHGNGRWLERIEWRNHRRGGLLVGDMLGVSGMLCINGNEIDPLSLYLSPREIKRISTMKSGDLSEYFAKWCLIPELDLLISFQFDDSVCCGCNGFLCAWNIKTGQQVFRNRVKNGPINKIIWIPETDFVVVEGRSREKSLWNIRYFHEVATLHFSDFVLSAKEETVELEDNLYNCFFSKESALARLFCEDVIFLDAENSLTIQEMIAILYCDSSMFDTKRSKDKQRIAICPRSTNIIRVLCGNIGTAILLHPVNIIDFCLDEHGKRLIVYGEDANVHCYNVVGILTEESDEKATVAHYPVDFIWPSIDARNIYQCDFRDARFCGDGEAIGNTLRLNGAILD